MITSISLNYEDTASLIEKLGHGDCVLVQGEMGIGKSSLLKYFSDDYKRIYFDCATMQISDLGLPWRTEQGVEFIPLDRLGLDSDQPVVLCLDELTKAQPELLNALLPLLLEGRLFGRTLPKGSIRFATGNLTIEGLGDLIPRHAIDRLCVVQMSKPSAKDWVHYAIKNKLNDKLIQWVMATPEVLGASDDSQNPYTPNIDRAEPSCTPRSLESASRILDSGISGKAREAAISGRIGKAGAKSLLSYIAICAELPTLESIMSGHKVKELGSIDSTILVFKILEWLKDDSVNAEGDKITAWVEANLESEAKLLFMKGLSKGRYSNSVKMLDPVLRMGKALKKYL